MEWAPFIYFSWLFQTRSSASIFTHWPLFTLEREGEKEREEIKKGGREREKKGRRETGREGRRENVAVC